MKRNLTKKILAVSIVICSLTLAVMPGIVAVDNKDKVTDKFKDSALSITVTWTKPTNGLYKENKNILPLYFIPLILILSGGVDIECTVEGPPEEIDHVDIYLNNELIVTEDDPPFGFSGYTTAPFGIPIWRDKLTAIAYLTTGSSVKDSAVIWFILI